MSWCGGGPAPGGEWGVQRAATLQGGTDGPNGVYRYGASGYPTQSFQASNYWVDVVFDPNAVDTSPPTVIQRAPAPGATGVATGAVVTATFSEPAQQSTVAFDLPGSRRTGGRPGLRRGYVQRWATSSRCQRRIVPGLTKKAAHRSRGSRRDNAASSTRSARLQHRPGDLAAQHHNLVPQHHQLDILGRVAPQP